MQNSLPKNLFPFIWYFLREYKSAVIMFVVLAISAGFAGPFYSMLVKQLINLLPNITNSDLSILILPASLIVINFIVFDNFTWRGLAFIRAKFTPIILNKIAIDLMNYALGKSHQFYQENLSGKVLKHITNLVDGIETLTTNIASNFLRGASLLFTACLASYFANPIFCLILLIWVVFFITISAIMSRRVTFLSDIQSSTESIVVGEMLDSLSNHSNVRIFAGHLYEKSRIEEFFKTQQKAYTAVYLYSIIMHSIQGALIAIMMAFLCYFLISLYGEGLLTIGDFALILGLSMETAYMMWYTCSELDAFNKALGRCKQSLSALNSSFEIKDDPSAYSFKCMNGQITFSDVSFNYKGSHPLFQNQSIEIKPKQKVGLVGLIWRWEVYFC